MRVLAWSRGDVNRLFTAAGADQHQHSGGCKMGLVLQRFYQQCRLLPLGMSIAHGEAAESRQHIKWASGDELLQQINALSKFNHQPAPPHLQAHGFRTIVCIGLLLQTGGTGRVLEIGTTKMVPESDEYVLSQILNFTKRLGAIGTSHLAWQAGGPTIMTSSMYSFNIANYHGKADDDGEHIVTPGVDASNAMQITYGSKVMRQAPSLDSSSYRSSSLATSSSPSPEQIANTSSMTLSPSPSARDHSFNGYEEMLMSPASSSVQAIFSTPVKMVASFGQLDILNPVGHIDTSQYGTIPAPMPPLRLNTTTSCELHDMICADPAPSHFSPHRFHLSEYSPTSLFLDHSSANYIDASSPPSLPSLSDYILPQHTADHHDMGHLLPYILDCMIQPIQDAVLIEHNISASTAAAISEDRIASAKSGKQEAEIADAVLDGAPEKSSSVNGMHNVVQPGSPINSSGLSMRSPHREMINLNQMMTNHNNANSTLIAGKDPKTGAFRPWSRSSMLSCRFMKGITGIAASTNRYNLKQIMRFHLPRIADMIHERAATAVAAKYVLMTGLAENSIQKLAGGDYITRAAASDQQNNINEAAAAKQHGHMFAERKRRRKQGDCLHLLRTLVPNISKRDKVTTLERTIEYLKELQSLVHDSQQHKTSLKGINSKEPQRVMARSYSSHDNAFLESLANLPSLLMTNATCEFYQSSDDRHVLPHFELGLTINVKDVEVNSSVIKIINALQQKRLHCIDLKLEFHQTTNNMCAKILAQYKDEDNLTPNLEDIHAVKRWWKNYIETIAI